MNEKGISLMVLLVTIVIIIILASIGGYYTIDTISKAERLDLEEELRNVEELVSVQRARVQNGEYKVPETYVATDAEIKKYEGLLSSSDIEEIKRANNADIPPEYKYHLMNQQDFDAEFEGETNVRHVKREYLINYGRKVIILNNDGNIIIVGKIHDDTTDENEIRIVFTPNGNTTWEKTQSTVVTVTGNVTNLKYQWLQTQSEPDPTTFVNTFFSGNSIPLNDKTGNDWYLWVYAENANGYSQMACSEAFYIDNATPEGTLTVE